MSDDDLLRVNPRVAWVRTANRVSLVKLDEPASEPLFLVGTACEIWELLHEGLDVRDVSYRLAAEFGVPFEQVAEDVAAFVAHALDMTILVPN